MKTYENLKEITIKSDKFILKNPPAITFVNFSLKYHALANLKNGDITVLITWSSNDNGKLINPDNPEEIRIFDFCD